MRVCLSDQTRVGHQQSLDGEFDYPPRLPCCAHGDPSVSDSGWHSRYGSGTPDRTGEPHLTDLETPDCRAVGLHERGPREGELEDGRNCAGAHRVGGAVHLGERLQGGSERDNGREQ